MSHPGHDLHAIRDFAALKAIDQLAVAMRFPSAVVDTEYLKQSSGTNGAG